MRKIFQSVLFHAEYCSKRYRYIFLLLFFPIPFTTFSQDIRIQARVVDSMNQQPVSFATIVFDNNRGTITDESGFFQYPISRYDLPDSVMISCLGYNTVKISFNLLDPEKLDTIYIHPGYFDIAEVDIIRKAKKSVPSDQIIKKAIDLIPENYSGQSLVYTGYYREYLRKDDDYFNLFESIIDLLEPGIKKTGRWNSYTDSSWHKSGIADNREDPLFMEASLKFKRVNPDFPTDSFLVSMYDNQEKYVPYAFMPITGLNELVILRSIDPISNFTGRSVSFINTMESDFLRNHEFNPPKLVYQDDRLFYYIEFTDNRNYSYGNARIRMTGSIFIDAENFGIRKLSYKASLDMGISRQNLFSLNVEYKMKDGLYYLAYTSHNNLFKSRNFILEKASFDNSNLVLSFSRDLLPATGQQEGDIRVLLNGFEQEIDSVRTNSSRIMVSFSENSAIQKKMDENRKGPEFLRKLRGRKSAKWLLAHLKIEFKNLVDSRGTPLSNKEFTEYYQYREFFAKNQDAIQGNSLPSHMNFELAVIENQVLQQDYQDTSWINTPLIKEELRYRNPLSSIAEQNRFLENEIKRREEAVNEILYLHTDREVYSTDDTLWFKAYVRNDALLTPSRQSSSLFVRILDDKSNIVSERKYLLENGEADGNFLIDRKFRDGTYSIVAFTSWMKNFSAEGSFLRKFLIRQETRESVQMVIALNRKEFFPGDTVGIMVHCYDELNRDIRGVKFSWELLSGSKTISSGKGNTDESAGHPISLVLPLNLQDTPQFSLHAVYEMNGIDTLFTLPVCYNLNVHFFPEGGHFIQGSRGRMAFKVEDRNGNPVNISGRIFDNNGKELITVGTKTEGMGEFPFKPEPGTSFYLKIDKPAGFMKTYPLPPALEEGWQLSVRQTPRKILAEIEHNYPAVRIGLITLMVRGYLAYYKVAGIPRNYSLEIPVAGIPAGIGVLTVFDEQMIPVAERLVFIRPADSPQPGLMFDHQSYLPRDSVLLEIDIRSKGSVRKGSYSLSVYDDLLGSCESIEDRDIREALLLTPEIRGKIRNASFYLSQGDDIFLPWIELLMMTQGWRDYSMAGLTVSIPVNMELISGSLVKPKALGGNEVSQGMVDVFFAGESVRIKVGTDGRFSFLPLYSIEKNTGIFISAEDQAGSSHISIELDKTPFEKDLAEYLRFLTDSLNRDHQPLIYNYNSFTDHFSRSIENHQWLEEVVISRKAEKKEFDISDLALRKRSATADQLNSAIDMEQLTEMVYVPNRTGSPAFYVVDGILQFTLMTAERSSPVRVPDYTWVNNLSPKDLLEYTVVRGPEAQALYGYEIEYVIDIKTKPLAMRKLPEKWINPVRIERFEISKKFYSPSYAEEKERYRTIPDLRKTIYWNPDLRVDENGKASIRLFNGDRYTRIRCVLEGINMDGITVHAESYWDVSSLRE